jgi:hypothetical protein
LDIVDNLFVCAYIKRYFLARVAELEDALDLGSSPRKRIGVQVPSLAPNDLSAYNMKEVKEKITGERNKPGSKN